MNIRGRVEEGEGGRRREGAKEQGGGNVRKPKTYLIFVNILMI